MNEKIRAEVENLFSNRGLSRNIRLKKLILESEDGFIPIKDLLLNSNLIRITQSALDVKSACEGSSVVEIISDPLRIRRKGGLKHIKDVDSHIERIIRIENIDDEIFSKDSLQPLLSVYGVVTYLKLFLAGSVKAAEVEYEDPECVLDIMYDYRHELIDGKLKNTYMCTLFEFIEFKKMRKLYDKMETLSCFYI